MVLSEIGKEELAALQTLTDTTRAGPKPSDGRYEFPLMDKLEIKDWEPNKGWVLVEGGVQRRESSSTVELGSHHIATTAALTSPPSPPTVP